MSEQDADLPATLARVREESHLEQAARVRDWQEGPERAEQAKLLIREALVEWATGKINQETESRLYAILKFAMPGLHGGERDDFSAEYQQQLNRQQCVVCGDGVCPTKPTRPQPSPPSES